MSRVTTTPDLVPVLSAGKHRNPRKGACFMEMASFLAGEKWSDHPKCTHPLLASMARLVNDALSDEERPRIATLVPDVVGLVADDLEVDVALAIRAAASALPVASATRQNVLAVGLLTARRMLEQVPGEHADLERQCEEAFAQVPDSLAWARRYARDARVSERVFRRQTAPHIVAYAVEGIAVSCTDGRATHLVDLLRAGIGDVRSRVPAPEPVAHTTPAPSSTRPSLTA